MRAAPLEEPPVLLLHILAIAISIQLLPARDPAVLVPIDTSLRVDLGIMTYK